MTRLRQVDDRHVCNRLQRSSIDPEIQLRAHLLSRCQLIPDLSSHPIVRPQTVMNATLSIANVRYGTPLPGTVKLARGLFTSVAVTHKLLLDPRRCESGIRVVFAPSAAANQSQLLAITDKQREDLLSGAFKDKVASAFVWTALAANTTATTTTPTGTTTDTPSSSLSYMDLARKLRGPEEGRGLSSSSGGEGGSSASSASNPRSRAWVDLITPVLNGSIPCNWTALNITDEWPFIRYDGFCQLVDPDLDLFASSACLTTLLAYLTTDASVSYIEPFPVVSPSNVYAAPISQAESTSSKPMWTAGINGTGQVAQVVDTGLVRPVKIGPGGPSFRG